MFQERYNRIVLPFIFLLDLSVLLGFYFFFILQLQLHHFLLIIPLWSIPSLYFKSYHIPRTYTTIFALKPMLNTVSAFLIIYVVSISIGFLPLIDTHMQIYFILSTFLLLFIASLSRYYFFYQYRLQGKNTRYAVILSQEFTAEILENLNKDALHFGYRFVEYFSTPETFVQQLHDLVNRQNIDLVFIKESNNTIIDKVSAFCDEHGLRLKLVLSLSASSGIRAGLDLLGGYPIMDLRHEPLLYLGNRILKRIVDYFMASLSIIFVLIWLPIVVKIAQIISYPGPLFFIQDRIGRDGKIFKLFKFRTMIHSTESELAKKGKAKKTHEIDTRIPWFGRFLRRTNLDEYPQFINVLFGSMSTVGPRPHMVGEDKILEKNVPRYRLRRFVKPGITGWAAVNGYRGGTDDMKQMTRRTDHDIWYLENWSIWLDIKIIAITIWQMLTFRIPRAY